MFSTLLLLLFGAMAVVAVPTPTDDMALVPEPSCSTAPWKTGTCCKNELITIKQIENGKFDSYVCDYDKWAELKSGSAGFICNAFDPAVVKICCNGKKGSITPLGDGTEVSQPSTFSCQGLSVDPEHVFPTTTASATK